ncbi:MAG: hypothetical protein PHW64_02965 [Sulfuricurvum sp.]|nr:hypothetical protein [Sulfuricurvum sp.]
MIKMVQAFLTGVLFTLVFDFLFFLGLKLNYIDMHGIKLYFNPFFVDNQNIGIYLALSLIIGWLSTYLPNRKSASIFIVLLFILSLLPLIPSFGGKIGDILFRHKNLEISIPPHLFRGDTLYTDRHQLYFYDTDLNRLITLPKEKK